MPFERNGAHLATRHYRLQLANVPLQAGDTLCCVRGDGSWTCLDVSG
jgi:hypothetical protein